MDTSLAGFAGAPRGRCEEFEPFDDCSVAPDRSEAFLTAAGFKPFEVAGIAFKRARSLRGAQDSRFVIAACTDCGSKQAACLCNRSARAVSLDRPRLVG